VKTSPGSGEAALRDKFFNFRAHNKPRVISITPHAGLQAISLRRPNPGASIELTT
jgi:hypothetical protein